MIVQTDDDGRATIRGFLGDYEVRVQAGVQTATNPPRSSTRAGA